MFNDKFLLTQAVLNGTKTMTRRLLKVPKTCNGKEVYSFNILTNNAGTQCVDLVDENEVVLGSWEPHYEVGEVVAIAQSYKEVYPNADFEMVGDGFMKESSGWTNKMFVKADLMPHHIIITDVKVERLQDITNEDCLKEGVKFVGKLKADGVNDFTDEIERVMNMNRVYQEWLTKYDKKVIGNIHDNPELIERESNH